MVETFPHTIVTVVEDEWYENSGDYVLPFEKNLVELQNDHPFLEIPLVRKFIVENQDEIVFCIDKRSKERGYSNLTRSGLFRIYTWRNGRLNWKFDCRSTLMRFKVKGEFSEDFFKIRDEKRERSKKFGL